jgi:hypothetical protein
MWVSWPDINATWSSLYSLGTDPIEDAALFLCRTGPQRKLQLYHCCSSHCCVHVLCQATSTATPAACTSHYVLFHDKHWIIRARFRVSHRRPGPKDVRFGSAISLSLSLSLLYAIHIWAASFILFHVVRWNGTDSWFSFFSFKTYYWTQYFECNLFNLF